MALIKKLSALQLRLILSTNDDERILIPHAYYYYTIIIIIIINLKSEKQTNSTGN